MSQGPSQAELDRLAADLRVFDANGIERAAWGWDRHERRGLDAYHGAERAALALIEQHDLGLRWEEFRRMLFAREHLSREQYVNLVEPMAEALPWLLPDRAPAPRPPQ